MQTKTPQCLKQYLENTPEGSRNSNLFTAMKKIRELNPEHNIQSLEKTCTYLNKQLQNPLKQLEVKAIARSIYNNDYPATCKPFQKYCDNCIYSLNRRPYNTTQKDLWKSINKDNQLKILLPGVEAHPWDIEPLDGLTAEQQKDVMELRQLKGINPRIDLVMTMKKVKIGDEAREDWLKYCEGGKPE